MGRLNASVHSLNVHQYFGIEPGCASNKTSCDLGPWSKEEWNSRMENRFENSSFLGDQGFEISRVLFSSGL